MQQAISEGQAIGQYQNAEGRDIVGVYVKNDNYPWIIALEVDEAEAFLQLANKKILLQ